MDKMTAVEWLAIYLKGITSLNCDEVIAKAIQMEREQIMDAANLPIRDRWYDATKFSNCGEQHYNETYGK